MHDGINKEALITEIVDYYPDCIYNNEYWLVPGSADAAAIKLFRDSKFQRCKKESNNECYKFMYRYRFKNQWKILRVNTCQNEQEKAEIVKRYFIANCSLLNKTVGFLADLIFFKSFGRHPFFVVTVDASGCNVKWDFFKKAIYMELLSKTSEQTEGIKNQLIDDSYISGSVYAISEMQCILCDLMVTYHHEKKMRDLEDAYNEERYNDDYTSYYQL